MFTRCWKKVSAITNVHYKSLLYIEVFLWEFDRDMLLPDVRYIACPLQTSLTVETVVQKCYIKEAFSKAAACKFPSKESLLKNFAKFKGKHLHWSLFFNMNACNFITKKLQRRCFPVFLCGAFILSRRPREKSTWSRALHNCWNIYLNSHLNMYFYQ